MRTVAILNAKGGCGRTTCAINLAAALSTRKQRALLLDLDPKSHCAEGLAVPADQARRGMDDLLLADPARPYHVDEVQWTVGQNFDLIPAGRDLGNVLSPTGPLSRVASPEMRLNDQLRNAELPYAWCLIDVPSGSRMGWGLALQAADEVLIPVETGYLAWRSIHQTLESLDGILLSERLPVLLLPTMHISRSRLCDDILKAMRHDFGGRVSPTAIHFSVKIRECASLGQSIMEFAPGSRAAAEFGSAADWLIRNAPATVRDRGPRIQRVCLESTTPLATAASAAYNPASGQGENSPSITVLGSRAAEIAMRTRLLRQPGH